MRVSGARIDEYADALADARAVPRADTRAGIRADATRRKQEHAQLAAT